MPPPGPSPDVTLADTLAVFQRQDRPADPLTAVEVAEELDCTRRTAHRKLERLDERGDIETKKVGARSRVWWLPSEPTGGVEPEVGMAAEEIGEFVRAVEDYAIFTLDAEGRVASWNEGAERIKGYAAGEIVGEHFSTFYTADAVEAGVPEENLAEAAASGRVEDEGWRVRSDGTEFWANVVITAIRDDAGDLRGFTKVTRDLTERKAAEDALAREREFLDRLLDASPVGIASFTADGEVEHANPRAEELLGVPGDEILEYSVGDGVVHDAEGELVPEEELPFVEVFETGESVSGWEGRIERPDGERRWVSVNAAPVEDDDGAVERVVVTGLDVTELKERERELRRERNQTEEFLRTAPAAIAIQDADGETVMANRRAEEILGLSERELIEEPDDGEWTVCDADGEPLDPEETPSARVRRTGEPVYDEEIGIIDPTGERTWLAINAAPVFDADGDLHRVITAGEDITQVKQQARRLAHRREELEAELNEVYERIDDGFYALDDQWRVTYLNEGMAELIGQDEEELLGETLWERFPSVAGSITEDRYREAMATQEPVHFERYIAPLDAWVELHAYPSETGLSVYVEDVTDRKQRQRELERYEAIVETVQDGVYTVDTEGRFTMVNDAYAEMTGYDEAELLGRHASEVVDEDTLERAQRYEEDLVEGERDSAKIEADVLTADGGTVRAEATFAILPGASDRYERVGVVRDVTERAARERELERYETVVETVEDGVYAVDEDYRFTMLNEAYAELVGRDRSELLGEHVSTVVGPDVVETGERLREELIAGDGEGDMVEIDIERPDGEVVPTEIRYGMLPLDDGDFQGTVGVIRDVSERKERERELERAIDLLEHTERVADVGSWEIDPETMAFSWSENLFDILEVPHEEEPSLEAALEVFHEADRPAVREAVSRAVSAGDPIDEEARFVTPDGEVRWLRIQGEAETADGTVASVRGAAQDVTERVERERDLEEQRERYRQLVEVAPVSIGMYDADGEITYVNEAAAELLGAGDVDELLGEPAIEFVHPDDRGEAGDRMGRVIEEREPAAPRETRLRTVDGEEKHAIVTSAPITRAGVPSAQVVITDITDRKERERELAEYRRIVETVDDGVYVLDGDRRFVRTNEAFASMTRFDREELRGMHATTVFGEDFTEIDEEARRKFAEGDLEVMTVEEDLHPARGEPVTVENRFKQYDLEGAVGRVGVVRDVTERRERELALARYKTVFDTVDDGIHILGPDFRFQEVNDAYVEMTGYDRAELLGSPYALVAGEDVAEEAEALAGDVAGGDAESATLEADVETADGDRFPAESKFTTLPAKAGPRGSVGVVRDLTDRRAYERELRRAETLIEESTDVNAIIDGTGTFQYVTPSAEFVLGYEPEELVGESAWEYVHPDDVAETEASFAELREGTVERPANEFRFRHADGSWVWLEARGRNLRDDPVIDGLVVYTRDVTDRKAYERELEVRTRQQEAISELGRAALENPEVDELFAEAAELVADTLGTDYAEVLDLDPEADELRLRQGVGWDEGVVGEATVAADERSQAGFTLQVDDPVVVADLDGETRFSGPELLTSHDVTSGVSTVIGPTDDPWGVLGTHDTDRRSFSAEDVDFVRSVANVLADAIRRHEYQEELEDLVEQLERFERMVETAHDGVYATDGDGHIIFVNDAFVSMGQHTREELLGAHGSVFFGERFVDTDEEEWRDLVDGERDSVEFEAEIIGPNGEDRVVHNRFVPLEIGDEMGRVGVTRDITELKEYQRRLEESNERLEQFAYVASHDLQEPLRMVSSYLQLIEDRYADELDEDAEEFIDYAVDGAERMRAMIDGLLSYSRVDTEAESPEPTDAEAVLDRTLSNLRMQIEDTDAEVAVGSLPTVLADASQLEQVFQNLVSNAIKYRADEPPRIEIDAELRDGRWRFHVADNGIGMDPRHVDRIFDVFDRLHSHDEYPGTGIGLALCEKIVGRHGGEIWVDSTPGEGSTFYFTLPPVEDPRPDGAADGPAPRGDADE